MNAALLAAAETAGRTGDGEAVVFWILAPVAVLAAVGMLVTRKAVHSALLLATVMVSLAVMYLLLEAPFLFAVQIIVYTGAILMLFLFVMMLIGVDASDSTRRTPAATSRRSPTSSSRATCSRSRPRARC